MLVHGLGVGHGLGFSVGHGLWFGVRRVVGHVIGFGVWHRFGSGVGRGLGHELGFSFEHVLMFVVGKKVTTSNVLLQQLMSYSGIFALFRLERLLKSFHTNTQ